MSDRRKRYGTGGGLKKPFQIKVFYLILSCFVGMKSEFSPLCQMVLLKKTHSFFGKILRPKLHFYNDAEHPFFTRHIVTLTPC